MARADNFSTFMTIVEDPAYDRKIDRFTQTGVRGFNQITAAANNASSAVNRMLVGGGTGGLGTGPTRALQQQAAEARNAAKAHTDLANVAPRAASSQRMQTQAAEAGARANSALARSLVATSTALNVVQGPLGPLAGRFGAAARAIGSLSGIGLGAAAFGGIAFGVARMGVSFTQTEGKLRPFLQTQRQVNAAMAEIVGIANRSRASLDATADLYVRLTQNATQFGISQARVGRITELASKAATLSGGTRQSQEAALYQFSQAIGSNRLGGDELRSINEQASQLSSAIAQGMGVAFGELRRLGQEGALTTQVVVRALERSAATIEERFSRLPRTLTTAATEFKNNFTVVVGQMDRAIGLSSTLATVLSGVANNLHAIISLAAGVGVSFAAIRLGRWVGELGAARAQMQGVRNISTGISQAALAQATVDRNVARQQASSHRSRIGQLAAQKAALQANIRQMGNELRAAEAVNRTNAFRSSIGQPVGQAAAAQSTARAAELRQRLMVATADLNRLQAAGATTGAAYAAAQARATAAQTALERATRASQGATRSFGASVLAVTRSAVFWQIAIAAVATALIYLATRQSASQRASEAARRAMEEYGRVIDETTGKVRRLTEEERARAEISIRTTIREFESGSGRLAREQLGQELTGRAGRQFGGPVGPVGGATDARVEEARRLRRGLENPATYDRTIVELNRLARAGNEFYAQFLQDNQDALNSLAELAAAYRTALNERRGLNDPNFRDPQVAERLAREEAERAARVQEQIALTRRRNQAENTLDDNARYRRNLEDVYGELNQADPRILSPEQIQTRQNAIARLRRLPLPAGEGGNQALARADAIRGMTNDLTEAMTVTERYRGSVERLARERTQAQTAQRDYNAEVRQGTRIERDAEQQARATAATNLNAQLVALERRRPQMAPQEYIAEQVRLLALYDAEIDRINERAGSSQRAATRMIQDARATARAYEQLREKREEILGRYSDEPRPVVRSRRDIRELTEAQQTLGEGLYPRAVMEADVARIEEGLLRPMDDLLRDYHRQREVQLLMIAGREVEAEALRQAYQLYDAIGNVSELQFSQLVRNADEQQRINDILQRRERIVSLVTGAVDNMRSTLEQFLLDVRSKPGDAAKQAWQSISRNFMQIQVRQLVERFTAGTDERVRTLISGRQAVDVAYRQFASQLTTAQEPVMSLASATRRAADIIVGAANDIRVGVQGALAAPGSSAGAPNASAVSGPVGVIAEVVDRVVSRRERMIAPIVGASLANLGGGHRYGTRTDPFTGQPRFHAGVDLPRAAGTGVRAAYSGEVITAGPYGGFGNAVRIKHGDGLVTLYGHLSRLNVTVGQLVRQGERVGGVGSTGRSTGNHLHFGAYRDGRPIDPSSALSALVSMGGGGQSAGASNSAFGLDDVARVVNSIPLERSFAEELGDQMAESLRGMRARNTAAAARQLGAYDTVQRPSPSQERPPTARETYNAIGESVGERLDQALGTKFFKGMGQQLGTAIQGAQYGQMSSGIARQFGLKQSNTGAQIGGAVGAMGAAAIGLPPEVGGFIGGLIGGTIGGLFKKTKTGSATVGMADFGGYSVSSTAGNNKQRQEAARGIAGSFVGGLEDIARQLGGTVGNFGKFSFGIRKDKFILDPTGSGRLKGGSTEKFESEQEAIARALELAISRGAVEGISAASQKILKSGQDLQRALEKAVIIESIPRRLLQKTNPVRAAVEELNREFVYMIQILKEAGATGEQFAQAQQLYDLDRAEAVKQAAETMFGAIEDYMIEMMGGASSPLNRRTVFDNSQREIQKYVADIRSGKVVDQQDLLNAAKNFQDASRGLKGSSQGFFADFDWLYSLLGQAKANAAGMGTATAELPASPFASDQAVQDAIARAAGGTTDAVNTQTTILSGQLETLIEIFGREGREGESVLSTISALIGFGGAGSSTRSV